MAIVRKTMTQSRGFTRAEKARLDALTDDQINAAARSDPDNPLSTRGELAKMAAIVRKRGRPVLEQDKRKVRTTLRLDPDVLERFREMGPGWQTQINETLRHVGELAKQYNAVQHKTLEEAARAFGKMTSEHAKAFEAATRGASAVIIYPVKAEDLGRATKRRVIQLDVPAAEFARVAATVGLVVKPRSKKRQVTVLTGNAKSHVLRSGIERVMSRRSRAIPKTTKSYRSSTTK